MCIRDSYEPFFPVRPEFSGAGYLDRYRILCQKLILERHYTATALVWTSDKDTYGAMSEDISLMRFLQSFYCFLSGVSYEFK